MASTATLRITVDNAPAQELITRVRDAAAQALTAARAGGQELTAEATVDAVLGAVLAEILRVRQAISDEATVARVRALERRLWENADGRTMPISAVCHSIANDLRAALDAPPEKPKCARCKGRGYVPDWTNWDAYHGEPKPKPCPDCQTTEGAP